MTDEATTLDGTPVTAKDRNKALDITRGFAVLGILLVNIYMAAQYDMIAMFTVLLNDLSQSDQQVWKWVNILLIGPSRALFSMMFGAGMVLLLDRLSTRMPEKQVKGIYFRRLFVLLGIALIDFVVFLWWGDVLNAYALAGMLLYLFRNRVTKTLMIWAAVFMIMASLLLVSLTAVKPMYEGVVAAEMAGETLTAEQQSLLDNKDLAAMVNPEDARIGQAKQRELYKGDWATIAPALWMKGVGTFIANFIMVLWDAMFMMLLGIWAYRKGWLTGEASSSTYVKMSVLGLGLGLGFRYYLLNQMGTPSFESAASMNIALLQPSRMLIAFGYLGLIQLFAISSWGAWLKGSIGAVGQMALTNYLMHSIIFMFTLYGFGLGLYDTMSGVEMMQFAGLIFVAQMIISPLWLKSFRFGPFEWLWRSMTYGKRQQFKK